MLLLGYDIGSSSVKAALVDGQTRTVLAEATYPDREMAISSPQEGWAEQDPKEWWSNLVKVTDRLFSKTAISRKEVSAIGITYQMHGLVALDSNGQVVRPAIIWCDSRAVEIGEQAFQAMGKEHCLNHLLNSPGNFTASKLKWVQEHEPENYERIAQILLPGDYIAFQLTEERTTTNTGLSEGIFWDHQSDQVSERLLDHFGFDPGLIPRIVPVFGLQGTICASASEELGFSTDTRVSYRAGDQPNNAFTLGALEPGDVAATAGTSGVVYGVVDELRSDPLGRVNTFAHVNHQPNATRLGVLLCVNGTGIAYSWLRNNLRPDKTYEELEKVAALAPAGSEGLRMLPFGNGAERMLGNQQLGAQLHHLQFNRHRFEHLVRATLEGIAFSLVYGLESMKEGAGVDPQVIKAGNDNLFQSEIFASTIATLTGATIQIRDTTGAVGAALGAGVGVGVFHSPSEAQANESLVRTHRPNPTHLSTYQQAYHDWRSLLPPNPKANA